MLHCYQLCFIVFALVEIYYVLPIYFLSFISELIIKIYFCSLVDDSVIKSHTKKDKEKRG